MPSSSRSSRIRLCSGRSPGSTLPPGNSHRPAIDLPAGRSAISTRPSASMSAQAPTRTTLRLTACSTGNPSGIAISRSIIAVDGDIFLGEVAGEDAVTPAPQAERHLKTDLGFFHHRRNLGFVIGRIAFPPMGHPNAAEPDREPVAIGRLAGFADRHDDAAPI